MKVMILGASGIVGQMMRLFIPAGVTPIWVRRKADLLHHGCDLEDTAAREEFLYQTKPDVILNLAGESSVDTVERDPARYRFINVDLPAKLALWAKRHACRYLHASTQAVWSGQEGGYPSVPCTEVAEPVNEYGKQKREAEGHVLRIMQDTPQWQAGATILRLTFILGIRPMPHVGRKNPLETWLDGSSVAMQVADRFFSSLMATDAARLIWQEITELKYDGPVAQFGTPTSTCRFALASLVTKNALPAEHRDLLCSAERPINTAYIGSRHLTTVIEQGITDMIELARNARAVELALFFGISQATAAAKLAQGFGPLHNEVTADFNDYMGSDGDMSDDARAGALLNWYRSTQSYIWELSAYHEDAGFNYRGTCESIAEGLFHAFGPRELKVLCLGDGIGDLTLALRQKGHDAWYHDLRDSKTAQYAKFRHWRQTGKDIFPCLMTDSFAPPLMDREYDVIVSLDYLEHIPCVRDWAQAIFAGLKTGGVFVAQNAFGIGSGPQGSMPMHLACNDHFEKDWDSMLSEIGFEQMRSQWYRKP